MQLSAFWKMGPRWGSMLAALAVLSLMLPVGEAAPRRGGAGRSGTADREMRNRRTECEKSTCSGMQDIERTECSYKCISNDCWSEVYSKDQIEEGEVDTERSRLFASCFRKEFKRETDAKREAERLAKAEARKNKAQSL
uniref:Uncharacterized protein n=1 Tax=Hemiselmis andersenii TaxID=464988 RepID=A0A6U4NHL6_HEMAN|mmetsp:Transcript_3959/g.9020  ORF Transcript_3959/g.9020 Transcript_3959/m.9020 type:complete len:139 (-) Transcript_3959:99-515(-)